MKKELLTIRAAALAEDVREQAHDLLKLSDDELVERAYDLVTEEYKSEDDWYWILGEIFERFSPEAELRSMERGYRGDDAEDVAINIAASRQGFYERQAARLAYRAAEFGGGDG